LQQISTILITNEGPALDLKKVVVKILEELDLVKEKEIIDFLNRLKSQKHDTAKDRYNKVVYSTSELDKLWRQINNNNEDFIFQLNDAKIGANRDKSKFIESLNKESDVSKKDLKEMKKNIDNIKTSLGVYDMRKISLQEIHDLSKELEKHEQIINNASSKLDTIEHEIEERKRLWGDYLAKTEVMDKLVRELLSLTPLLREKYERLIKTHNFCNNSLNGFFMVNGKIQENQSYETDETPCLNRDQIRIQLSDIDSKKDEYTPQVERYEGYDQQKLKALDQSEVQTFIENITSLIKDLDNDNSELDDLSAYLRDERKDFKDGDIYDNQQRIARDIDYADDKIHSIINEFEGIKNNVNTTELKDYTLTSLIKQIENDIVASGEGLEKAKAIFDEVCRDIDKENMDNAKLVVLAGAIERLGLTSQELTDLVGYFNNIDECFKKLQNELVDLYYSKKLTDMNNAYNLLLDRLARLIDLINKLIELANEMEGYTSDNEEETFINDLEFELKELKQHHSETEDELKLIEKEIIYLQNNLNQHPPEVDEDKANKVDNAIGDLSQMIENIEKLVDTKIQRLADMDPYKKFRRREKELNKLSAILNEREDTLTDLRNEVIDDLNNVDSPDDLKEVGRETLDAMETLEENLDDIKQGVTNLNNEIDA
jgi:hypothetical protein